MGECEGITDQEGYRSRDSCYFHYELSPFTPKQ
jgi:hypothetical protein